MKLKKIYFRINCSAQRTQKISSLIVWNFVVASLCTTNFRSQKTKKFGRIFAYMFSFTIASPCIFVFYMLKSFCEPCLSRILWRKGELFGTYLKLIWNLHHLEFDLGQDLSMNVIIVVWQIERQFTSLRCTTLTLRIVNLEKVFAFQKKAGSENCKMLLLPPPTCKCFLSSHL